MTSKNSTPLTPLQKANAAIKAMREAGETIERLDPIEKAIRNPSSLRLAINGKCWDCVGAGHDSNPRWLIGNCQIVDCPLHGVRPYKQTEGSPTPTAYTPAER